MALAQYICSRHTNLSLTYLNAEQAQSSYRPGAQSLLFPSQQVCQTFNFSHMYTNVYRLHL